MAEYDYGPGRTYAQPQDAFDACQAANESGGLPQNFAETNYLRGYGNATYPGASAGEPVLRLAHSATGRGVKPTQEHRLVIDRNGLDLVALDDDQDAGCIVGGKADGTQLASHVTVAGIELHSGSTSTGRGIIVCPDRTGGEFARDWVIQDLSLHATRHGIILGNLRSVRLEAVRFPGFAGGAQIFADGSAGTYGAFAGGLVLVNCTGRAEGKILSVQGLDLAASLFHCSFFARDHVLQLEDDGASATLDLILLNTILHTPTDSKFCLSTNFAELRVLLANANCYYFPGDASGLLDLNGNAKGFSEFQSRFSQDANSLNTDPLCTDSNGGDFTLLPESPCRMRGRAAAPAGLEGHERAISVDIGAYQPSLPANWSLRHQSGEITARIEGRVSMAGL